MKITKCDKCKITTEVRNPEVDGWTSSLMPDSRKYVDLCPTCSKEFDRVKNGAWNTFHATIATWLGIVSEVDLENLNESS